MNIKTLINLFPISQVFVIENSAHDSKRWFCGSRYEFNNSEDQFDGYSILALHTVNNIISIIIDVD